MAHVKRELEALTILGILKCDEQDDELAPATRQHQWLYSIGSSFDIATLRAMAGRKNVAPLRVIGGEVPMMSRKEMAQNLLDYGKDHRG